MSFAHVDRINVFYDRTPEARVRVGALVYDNHRALFEYDAAFRELGIELSPFHLGLNAGLLEAQVGRFDGLHGLFSDSLPDGWGAPPRLHPVPGEIRSEKRSN